MRVAQRLFLAVAPAILGVVLVAALAYWGRYQQEAPRWIIVVAAVASLSSLWMAWRNTRYVARRIEGLAGGVETSRATGRSVVELTVDTPDEIDSIERVVDNLSTAVSLATAEGRRQEHVAAERVREYASLLAEASSAVARQLEEVRLPLHILLESHFGDLNENQEEMIAAARTAADLADGELQRLREIAELDTGALRLRRDAIRPADVIQSLLPTLSAQGEREDVRVTADIAPLMPRVHGDRGRLQQALDLLLTERVRHAPAGGSVHIRTDASPGRLSIIVDHGSTPRVSAEETLARRLLVAHDGTVEERDGRTTITLPTG